MIDALNELPAFGPPAGGGVITYFSGVFGRAYSVSANYRF